MNNTQQDIRGGSNLFDGQAGVDSTNTGKPIQHFEPGSVAYRPTTIENLDSRPSNQPSSQTTANNTGPKLQTQLWDEFVYPSPVSDDYIFPSGSLTHGFNSTVAQNFQGNSRLATDGSINSSDSLSMIDQVWGANNTICDNPYLDSQYRAPGINNNNNAPNDYSSKYISPALLSPGLTPVSEVPVPSTDDYSQDKGNKRFRQPAWGGSRSSYNAKADSTAPSTRCKDSVSSSDTVRRYSATSTHHAENESPQSPSDDTKPKDHRASHNMIEKQYRNRLNDQFETLLRTLPLSTKIYNGGSEHRDNTSSERKVSKAEVLLMATQYIQGLEKESRRLKGDNEQLRLKKEELENAYVRLGGTHKCLELSIVIHVNDVSTP